VLILGRNPFEEFHRHFPALPHEEFPLNVYTCALSKDILLQGKMFVSQNWICFYSNIFGYETKVKIEMNRIVEIKREKTAFVVPNAISVQTPNKRFFFCSFLSRETVFRLLSRTWTAAVSKRNSIDSQDSNDKDLSRTGCSDAAVTLLDLSADDLPHAVCSDIDQVKTSSPIPTKNNSSLYPSVVHISSLRKQNGYNRVSITTKPETKITRWNTIADLREMKPSKRRKKELQFEEQGYEITKGPHDMYCTPRYFSPAILCMHKLKQKFAHRFRNGYKRLFTVSTLFYFIFTLIVILGLMSVVLLYKIHTLNQIFIERGHAFSPTNELLSANLHEVYKAKDVLRKLKEDLDR